MQEILDFDKTNLEFFCPSCEVEQVFCRSPQFSEQSENGDVYTCSHCRYSVGVCYEKDWGYQEKARERSNPQLKGGTDDR